MININFKSFQEDAIEFLLNKTTGQNSKKKIIMESPTGSGKTIILIGYIEKYLSLNFDDTVFCWICPGKGDLEEQSKDKMEKFSPNLYTGNLQDILLQGFIPKTTYFINWEMITGKTNKAINNTERANLYDQIKKAHNKNLKFIIIIDEEHLNNTKKADNILEAISAEYEIRVSATPIKTVQEEKYTINEIDVINEELITKAMYINKGLDDELDLADLDIEANLLIEKADELRKEIQKSYIDENEDIRPLVLIQFPNMNDTLIEKVEEKLNSMGYNYENGLVASWFSPDKGESTSKKFGKINIGVQGENNCITRNNAEPIFLLFKQALATGWDCPRAKILVKLRDNMSEIFEIQTLGRLRRMPKAKHYDNELLDCSYLFTFDEKYKRNVVSNLLGFETQRVFLKTEPKSIKLKKEIRDNDINYTDEKEIRADIYNSIIKKYRLDNNKIKNKQILENNGFKFGEKLETSYIVGKYKTLSEIEDIEGTNIIKQDINTHKHGIELQNRIDLLKKYIGLNYSKTRALLETLFRKDEGNSKYKILNLTLKEFYAFIINNFYQLKLDFISFQSSPAQKSLKQHKVEDFSIPLEENYKYYQNNKNNKILEKNVYKNYNSSMITSYHRSESERLFEKYCEKSSKVKYVYKNGDVGKNYLSIVYINYYKVQKMFYPDYIIQLENDEIWIIETKGGETKEISKNIDPQSENKFNQLKRFSDENNYNFAFVRDKDSELYYCNTEYDENMSTENWKLLEEIF